MRLLLAFLFSFNAYAGVFIYGSGEATNLENRIGYSKTDQKIVAAETADPSIGGYTAGEGSLLMRDNGGVGEAWLKEAATDTDWFQMLTTSSDIPASKVIYDGTETVEQILDDTLNSGVLDAVTFTDDGGLAVSWGAGEIFDETTKTVINTIAGSGSCPNNTDAHLIWISGTTLSISTTPPDISAGEIAVGRCTAQDGDILGVQAEFMLVTRESDISDGLKNILPVIVTEGLVTSEDADVTNVWDVSTTSGVYYHSGHTKQVIAAIDSRTALMHRNFKTAGAWDSDTNAEIDITQYNDGTNLVAVTANKYYKSLFIIGGNGVLYWVYPTEGFNSLAACLSADPPPTPGGFNPFAPSTTVVIKGSDTSFPAISTLRWQDVRPRIGTAGGTGVNSHSDLLDLTSDDHPQYPLMTGRALGQSIIGGTAASENLTLESTSDATKGQLILQPTGGQVLFPQVNDPAAPTMGFGDGNSGFYEIADNEIGISISGAYNFLFTSTWFRARFPYGAALNSGSATATLPVLTITGDTDTGIGRAGANQLSLIAGLVEGTRVNTVTSGVNYLDITPSITTDPVLLSTGGTDTDVDLSIDPKGAGIVQLQPVSGNVSIGGAAATGGNILDILADVAGSARVRVTNENVAGNFQFEANNDLGYSMAIGIVGSAAAGGFIANNSAAILAEGYSDLNIVNDGNHPINFYIDSDDAHALTPELKMSLEANGVTVFHNYVELTPVASDLASPSASTLMAADGTVRPAGIWEYRDSNWKLINTKGDPSRIALIDGDNTAIAGWDTSGLTNATFTAETTNELNGVSSYKLTNVTGSATEKVCSPAVTVPLRSRGRAAAFVLPYMYDGANDDITVQLYDNTAASVIESVKLEQALTAGLLSLPGPIPATTTSVEVCFVIDVVDNGKVLVIDDIEFTDDPFKYVDLLDEQTIRLQDSNGFGSTNTKIRRLSTLIGTNDNSVITYADSAADGASFTANKDCWVRVSYSENYGAGNEFFGISLDSAQLTTNVQSITTADRLNMSIQGTVGLPESTSWSGFISAGQVIRPHTTGAVGGTSAYTSFTIQAITESSHIVTPAKAGSQVIRHDGYTSKDGSSFVKFKTEQHNLITGKELLTTVNTTHTRYTSVKGCNFVASMAGKYTAGNLDASLRHYDSTGALKDENALRQISNSESSSTVLIGQMDIGDYLVVQVTNVFSDIASGSYFTVTATPKEATFLTAIPSIPVAYIKDVKSSGTVSATGVATTWTGREFTELTGNSSFVSLSSNQITLQKGLYSFEGSAPFYQPGGPVQLRVRDISNSATEFTGNGFGVTDTQGDGSSTLISGYLEVTDTTAYELQYYITTGGGNTLGLARTSGENETYAQVKITKLDWSK